MEARLQKYIWLGLFIISMVILLAIYTTSNFTTDTTINKNAVKLEKNSENINLTRAELEDHNRQTKIVTDRQTLIMDLITNRTGVDIELNHIIIHQLNAINDKADTALNMGKEINNKLDILLGNNTR